MKPYLAIVLDCFREAIVSRVLPFLLAGITLVLLLLAPLGIVETTGRTDFEDRDFLVLGTLGERLSARGADSPAEKRVRAALPGSARVELEAAALGRPIVQGNLTDGFNSLLVRPDFYDATAWKGHALPDEAAEIAELPPERRTESQIRRLNRQAIDVLFPASIRPSLSSARYVTYLGFTLDNALPLEMNQVPILLDLVIALFMSWFIGSIGVLTALVATANIIPNTFEAGMGDLFAARPLSRPGVFLARFVGGLAFILLATTYALGGLWLIVGLRFHAWLPQLLFSIPIFLFVFAIYFSVSAWVGLRTRNPVTALLTTGLFYVFCWSVSWTQWIHREFSERKYSPTVLVPDGPVPLMVDQRGAIQFRTAAGTWEQGFLAPHEVPYRYGDESTQLGPILRRDRSEYLALVLRRPNAPPSPRLAAAPPRAPFPRRDGHRLPADTFAFAEDTDGGLLVVRPQGVFRVKEPFPAEDEDDPALKPAAPSPHGEPAAQDKEPEDDPRSGEAEALRRLEPLGPARDVVRKAPYAAAFRADRQEAAIWSNGRLERLRRTPAGTFETAETLDLRQDFAADLFGFQDWLLAVPCYVGETLLLARGDGVVTAYGPGLKPLRSFRPAGGNFPRTIEAAPDGSAAVVLFHHGWGWRYDTATGAGDFPPLPEQGAWEAAAYGADGSLWTGTTDAVVRRRDPTGRTLIETLEPSPPATILLYRRYLEPIHYLLPKPNEFGYLLDYLRTGRETVSTIRPATLAESQNRQPVGNLLGSGLTFIGAVLAWCCFKLHRGDY